MSKPEKRIQLTEKEWNKVQNRVKRINKVQDELNSVITRLQDEKQALNDMLEFKTGISSEQIKLDLENKEIVINQKEEEDGD